MEDWAARGLNVRATAMAPVASSGPSKKEGGLVEQGSAGGDTCLTLLA